MYSDQELYTIFDAFLRYGDWYPHPIPGYPNYQIDRFGNLFDANNNRIRPYQYENQYDIVELTNSTGRRVFGVHQLVAMTFNSDWFPGCIVHHVDENKYNNNDWNLECMSRAEHARLHNPIKFHDMMATCDVCGKEFIWTAKRQQGYYSGIRRGRHRIKTCSRSCQSYAGRMTQLGRVY